MPKGFLKNRIYGAALPFLGKKCEWAAEKEFVSQQYFHAHTVGACYQEFHQGKAEKPKCFGFADSSCSHAVTPQTLFRTASLTKTVIAMLVMRLQTLGLLDTKEDISELWKQKLRNPRWPDHPITVGMLLSHTSGIVDSEDYYAAYHGRVMLSELLQSKKSYAARQPGEAFSYSNFAAGMIASLLEKRFQQSIETLLQNYLFLPLKVSGTLDITKTVPESVADDWRVLPSKLCFSAQKRRLDAKPLNEPDPENDYLIAAGGLLISSPMLAKLCLVMADGGNGFLDERSLSEMKTPLHGWPEKEIPLRHGMGLFKFENHPVYGHQGFAYGAVNGLFLDDKGNGFVSLTNGASEQRVGHLAVLNLQLVKGLF